MSLSLSSQLSSSSGTNAVAPDNKDLLGPIHAATSPQEQLDALHALSEQLLRLRLLPVRLCDNDDVSAALRESQLVTAVRLLQQIVVVGPTSLAALQSCVMACGGPAVAIQAAVQTLKDICSATSSNTSRQPSAVVALKSPPVALQVSLSVLHQLLCVRPKTREEVWIDQVIVRVGSATIDNVDNDNENDSVQTKSTLEQFVTLVTILPSLVANACHALQCGLSVWAVPARFRSRLVECASSSVVLLLLRKRQQPDANPKETGKPNVGGDSKSKGMVAVQYFQMLVQRMVRHHGGEDVTLGLYRQFERLSSGHAEVDADDDDVDVDVDDDGRKDTAARRIFANIIRDTLLHRLSPRESAILCRALFRHVLSLAQQQQAITSLDLTTIWKHAWLDVSCLPAVASSHKIRDAVVRLFILSPSSVMHEESCDRLFCHGVASWLASVPSTVSSSDHDNDDDDDETEVSSDSDEETPVVAAASDRALRKHLNEVAVVWSQTVFVRQTDHKMQRHVTFFLLSGMALLSDVQEDPSADFVANILEGVTARLHSTIDSIRSDGMQVGERLAKRLGQDLQFDELNSQRQGDTWTAPRPAAEQDNLQLVQDGATALPSRSAERKKTPRRKQMDPDAEYMSEDEESDADDGDASSSRELDDDDSVWGDENLIAYDLDDDEDDLRETARPLYLHECIELLRTAETEESAFSCHEAALKELSALVRSHPVDLADISESLAIELLRMENKFNIGNFTDMLLSSLIALAVEDPLSVGQTLVNQLFQEGSLFNRLTALTSLSEAAFELSGEKELEEWRRIKSQAPTLDGPRVSGKRRLVGTGTGDDGTSIASYAQRTLATNEPRTQRWGRGRKRTEERIISNRFGQIAPVWFYSLVGGFMERKEDPALWGGPIGSTLLARMFVTLASFVESSGNSPGTDVLAKDLFELVWSFRDAEVAEVRMAVLCAVAVSVKLLREEVLVGMIFSGAVHELPNTLQQIGFGDTDESCRNLAKMIARHVAIAIQSVGHERPTSNALDF